MPVMTGGRFLAEMLHGYGVSHLFFVPGIFHSALAAMEEKGIIRVLAHSEVAAAYMADGYARAARKPGVCMSQAVGAANICAGLRDAYLASSPVIAITGGHSTNSQYRHPYQLIDDLPMYESVTRFNARVEKLERFPDLLRQAFRAATTGSKGPVHLELAQPHGEAVRGEGNLELIFEKQFGSYPPFRPEPDMGRVREAADLLARAQRPVIIAGGGVTASDAATELVKLAETLSIPVATSLNAKAAIPGNHPLSMGLPGRYGRWSANQALQETDLVFFVGSRAGGLTTDDWKAPPVGTPVIQLDIEPSEVGHNYPAAVGLVGDAKVTLQRLLEVVLPQSRPEWVGRVQGLLAQWRSEMEPKLRSEGEPVRPERICQAITDFLPADAVVVADTGHSAVWAGNLIELHHPSQSFIRCAGTLGWALPASLGVKCALPERPVICFTGDGGFCYHPYELETAARRGLNVVVVVNNNHALQQSRAGVENAYGGPWRGRSNDMWVFNDVNLAKLAEDLGCFGVRVERPSELLPAMEAAFASGRPAVIDVVSDVDALPPKAWK